MLVAFLSLICALLALFHSRFLIYYVTFTFFLTDIYFLQANVLLRLCRKKNKQKSLLFQKYDILNKLKNRIILTKITKKC
jgi:hypothetical protein